MSTIAIGCDHGGFPYKNAIIEALKDQGFEVRDFGTNSADSTDYPEYAHHAAQAVVDGTADKGIVLCGSGNGVAMTANKHAGIRCALCWTPELARLARQHNDANMISIPVRFVTQEIALEMVQEFLSTEFEGGRHSKRVEKINC